jgi:hypothetical protein
MLRSDYDEIRESMVSISPELLNKGAVRIGPAHPPSLP